MENSAQTTPWLQKKIESLKSATAKKESMEKDFKPSMRTMYDTVLEEQYASAVELLKGGATFKYDDEYVAVRVEPGKYIRVENTGVRNECESDEEFNSLLTQGERILPDVIPADSDDTNDDIHYVNYDVKEEKNDSVKKEATSQNTGQPIQPGVGQNGMPAFIYQGMPPYGFMPLYNAYQYPSNIYYPNINVPVTPYPNNNELKQPNNTSIAEDKVISMPKKEISKENKYVVEKLKEPTEKKEDVTSKNKGEKPSEESDRAYGVGKPITSTETFLRTLMELQIGVTKIEAEKQEYKRRYDDALVQFEKANTALADKVQKNDEERVELSREKDKILAREKSFETELDNLKKELSAGFEIEKKELLLKAETAKKELDETTYKLKELQTSYDDMKKCMHDDKNEYERKLSQQEKAYKTLEDRYDKLNSNYEEVIEDRNNLENDINELKAQTQSTISAMKDKIENLTATCTMLQSQLSSSEKELEALKDNTSSKDDEVASLRQEKEDLIKKNLDKIESIEAEISEKDAIITELKDKLNMAKHADADLAITAENLKSSEKKVSDLNLKIEELKEKSRKAEIKVAELEKQVVDKNSTETDKLKQENERLKGELTESKKMIYTDSLTKVKNAAAFENEFKSVNVKNIILAIVSINGTKIVNDKFGTSDGDNMIIDVARTLADEFGKDYVYRIMGDQFYIIIRHRKYLEVKKKLEDIEASLLDVNEFISYGVESGYRYVNNPGDLLEVTKNNCFEMKLQKQKEYEETVEESDNGDISDIETEEPEYEESVYNNSEVNEDAVKQNDEIQTMSEDELISQMMNN